MNNLIQIIEKPDWVSWDDIHDVLWKAHAKNREKGIIMPNPGFPGDIIRKMVVEDHHGQMYVALVDGKLVGTAAIYIRETNQWYWRGKCAYCCFIAVLPQYNGMGIYTALNAMLERATKSMGLNCMMFNTHEKNIRMLDINKRKGYKLVNFTVGLDCFYVIMMKWLDGCPYSPYYIKWQYIVHKWYRKIRYKPGYLKRFGI